VTLTSTALRSDTAQGGAGGTGTCFGCNGEVGYGLGGGLYIGGGTVKLTNVAVNSNQANDGKSGIPNHPAFGGGLYIGGGTVTLCTDIVQSNSTSTPGGGGGIFIVAGAVYIDTSTVANTTKNTPNNIVGSYTSVTNC
jgi:hypothetical protein